MNRPSIFFASAFAATATVAAAVPTPHAPIGLAATAAAPARRLPATPTVEFRGTEFLMRWSQGNHYEITPAGQENLDTWTEMMTLLLYPPVHDGAGLATIANRVVDTYKNMKGVIVRTNSIPASAQKPAEYFVAGMLPGNNVMEFAAARFVLVDKQAVEVVFSHRAYGATDADTLGHWVQTHGAEVEQQLMRFNAAQMASSVKK